MRKQYQPTKRRQYLKKTALGLAGISATSVASAKQNPEQKRFDRIYNASLNILEKRGPEAQEKFLRKHDIPHTFQKNAYVMYPPEARGNSGGASTQSHFDEDSCIEPENCNFDPDLECSFSLTHDYYNDIYRCSLSARYRYQYEYDDGCTTWGPGWVMDGPLNPLDAFGIIWEYDHWKLANREYPHENMFTSSNVEWDNGSSQGEGAGYKADDRQRCYDTGPTEDEPYEDGCQYDETEGDYNWSYWLHGGVEIVTGPAWQSNDPVRGRYVYQYNDSNVDFSVGVAYPWGVSVSFSGSTSTKQKDTQTEPAGRNMELTVSDL